MYEEYFDIVVASKGKDQGFRTLISEINCGVYFGIVSEGRRKHFIYPIWCEPGDTIIVNCEGVLW